MEVGLSLGSNLGHRLGNLRESCERLEAIPGVAILLRSGVYETEPVDVDPEFKDQAFLNAIIVIETDLDPETVSRRAHEIEMAMGRIRSDDKNTPRTIDVDIIYAADLRREDVDLTLPHPRWSERRFVVQPLADVRPGLILPGTHESVQNALDSLPEKPKVVLFQEQW